ALDANEVPSKPTLFALQVGDEQQSDIEAASGSFTRAWFQSAHAGADPFPNALCYVNSSFANDTPYGNFIAAANPDMITFDSYPYGNAGFSQYNWLGKAQQFRRQGLGSYVGATGNAPRAY